MYITPWKTRALQIYQQFHIPNYTDGNFHIIPVMSKRKIFKKILIFFPFAGIGIVIIIMAYSGCPLLDSPFAFLGDECQTNGIHWNNIVAPIGTLSIFWIIIGPVIWFTFRILEGIYWWFFWLVKDHVDNRKDRHIEWKLITRSSSMTRKNARMWA